MCALSFVPAPAAQAALLFDVGPGGYVRSEQTASDLQTATVGPTHVPSWLQVVVPSGLLYAADSSTDGVLAYLPQYTFLRVLGGGVDRLEVQAYADSGDPGQTGWVDPNQVLPSAPGVGWLVASVPTTLWSAADGDATPQRSLDRFTPLQQLEDEDQGRIQVRVYRPDFSAVVDTGWVDTAATGPAVPPALRVASTSARLSSARGNNQLTQQAFLKLASGAARASASKSGVPASVTVAQAILESDWGASELSQSANNYFGMKAIDRLGDDGVVWMPTSEYDDSGQLYQITSAFRAYKSLADSVVDHDHLLATASRYSSAMQSANDPRQFAALIADAGYSSDPDYADKLVALMDRYDLYTLDS